MKPLDPKWYYTKFSVIMALVLFGPLAYPLLWKSPCFTRPWKWVITIIFTLLTILLIYSSWELFVLLYKVLREVYALNQGG